MSDFVESYLLTFLSIYISDSIWADHRAQILIYNKKKSIKNK